MVDNLTDLPSICLDLLSVKQRTVQELANALGESHSNIEQALGILKGNSRNSVMVLKWAITCKGNWIPMYCIGVGEDADDPNFYGVYRQVQISSTISKVKKFVAENGNDPFVQLKVDWNDDTT